MQRILTFFFLFYREELHAIASAKKLSSKNRALSEVRNYKKDAIMEEDGPSFEQGTEVRKF